MRKSPKPVRRPRRAKAAVPKKKTKTRRPAQPPRAVPPASRAALDRERRRLPDVERLDASERHMLSAARTGHDELKASLERHTETSPALAGGDVDARWEDAAAIGDEAPGGDNPTPGQDRVDDIGRALGVSYNDAEELRGSDKITDRDRHRWELDPASSDDWPHDRKPK